MILPIMPGIPFFVGALFCFQRSSPRLERWLLTNKLVGPQLRNWKRGKTISRGMKVLVLTMMAAAVPVIWFSPFNNYVRGGAITFLAISSIFVLLRPSQENSQDDRPLEEARQLTDMDGKK